MCNLDIDTEIAFAISARRRYTCFFLLLYNMQRFFFIIGSKKNIESVVGVHIGLNKLWPSGCSHST